MSKVAQFNPKGVMTRWGVGTVSNNIIEHCLQNSTSAAEEYIKTGNYLVNELGLEAFHVEEFDYAAHSHWAPKDTPLLKEAQSRAGGLKADRAKDYKDRFDGGETIKNPPIHFWTGATTITAIGHTRSNAKQNSTNSVGPAIFVDVCGQIPDGPTRNYPADGHLGQQGDKRRQEFRFDGGCGHPVKSILGYCNGA